MSKAHKTDQEVVSDFISLASHKLRTPLTAIIWYSELLLREEVGDLNPQQKEFLRDISSGSERMEHLISDLLAVSRIDRGKSSSIEFFEEKDLLKVFEEILKKKKIAAEDKQIKIKFTSKTPKKILAKIDSDKFGHVLRIVLDNAIMYADPKSTVTIDISKKILISITNKGPGVPKSDLKKIFKKGYRSPNIISEHPDSHGFGLFIAANYIKQHKGKIWCESTESKSQSKLTTFFIEIPSAAS